MAEESSVGTFVVAPTAVIAMEESGTAICLDFARHIIELVLAVEIDYGVPATFEAWHQACQHPGAGASRHAHHSHANH